MEEEEICRVCRSEGTPEQPLFHPCKCAGSIRYVHQDCLTEWLAHSRKKYCELCEHPFTFTPVYRQDMPDVLPAKLFLKQLGKKAIYGLTLTLRGAFVSCIWLILLPYFTIWIWRLYFFLGSSLSSFLVRVQQLQHKAETATTNTTTLDDAATTTTTENLSWLQEYKSKFTIQTFLADCFEGQIITCIVVVIFVAVFLLREWIVQNIPMEEPVAEDEDLNIVLDDLVFPDRPEPAAEELQQQPLPVEPHLNQNIFNNNSINDNDMPRLPVVEEIVDRDHEWGTMNLNVNDAEIRRSERASSMPPSLSLPDTTTDDGYNSDENEDKFLGTMGYRRAASMEPMSSGSMSPLASDNNESFDESNDHRAGHPPYAPRMRNAEVDPTLRQAIEEENDQFAEDNLAPPIQVQPAQQQRLRAVPRIEAVRQQPMNNIANNNNNPNNEDVDDEDEDNMEEFEGVLEAIGMQGSFWSLVQNCALMAVLIALSLAVVVWMPYMIGMLFIMADIADFLRLPLKLARLLTDPLVDFVFYVSTNIIAPWGYQFYHQYIRTILKDEVLTIITESVYSNVLSIYRFLLKQLTSITSQQHTELLENIPSSSSSPLSTASSLSLSSLPSPSSSVFASLSNTLNGLQPFLSAVYKRYLALATGTTPFDRLACITVGYLLVTILSCRYLTRSTNSSLARAIFGRTAQEAIRYQGIILKVGMFITIELVLFPIVCGFLLDFSTMPLFKIVTVASRVHYLIDHPVPSIFLHWFLGTGFMFLFAVLVTLCRDVVRPGVMWFIRDPNDPQFHPIREIVERPILFQLKKIGASALIYLTVILVGVGGVVHFIKHITELILPLRWNIREPLSTMPIDMMIIQIAIPAIMKYFKPKHTLKNLFIKWITFTCRQLRLSSFMFGGRKPEEEGTIVYHNFSAWLNRKLPSRYPPEGVIENIIEEDVSYYWDGQLLRVPRHDSVPIIENRRMLVPVDNFTLEPLDERERSLGHPASTAAGGDEVNTAIVYSPPHFKQRILAFVIFIWITTSLSFTATLVFPVLLGRYIFKEGFHVEHDVHDLYSFVLGGLILLFAGTLVHRIFLSLKEVYGQDTSSSMYQTAFQQLKQWCSWLLRWTFFFIAFGLAVPMSLGALAELYLLLPIKKLEGDHLAIPLLPTWVYGFIFMVVIHGFVDNIANNSLRILINNIFRGGISKMNVSLCVKKLLTPLLVTTATAIVLPYLAAFINIKLFGVTNLELRIRLMQMAYPFALVGISSHILAKFGAKLCSRLVQTIREDNYLVGRTLHNLEE